MEEVESPEVSREIAGVILAPSSEAQPGSPSNAPVAVERDMAMSPDIQLDISQSPEVLSLVAAM